MLSQKFVTSPHRNNLPKQQPVAEKSTEEPMVVASKASIFEKWIADAAAASASMPKARGTPAVNPGMAMREDTGSSSAMRKDKGISKHEGLTLQSPKTGANVTSKVMERVRAINASS